MRVDMLSETKRFQECQRVNVIKEAPGGEAQIKISVERYDDCLGWYSAGALSIPLHQQPLLQQALNDLQTTSSCSDCAETDCSGKKIIPFPTFMPQFAAQPSEQVVN